MSTAIDFKSLMRRAKKTTSPAAAQSSQTGLNTGAATNTASKIHAVFRKREKLDLEPFRIPIEGGDVFYIPNYIDDTEEHTILENIYDPEALPKWMQLSKRRLKTIGGIPAMSGTRKEPLPAWAESFIDVMLDSGLRFPSRPNHILLNEYSAGMGIAPHFDTDLYQPYVAVLNLQRPAMFHFFDPVPIQPGEKSDSLGHRPTSHLYLERKSLLIFAGKAFSDIKHGILSASVDLIDEETLNLHLLSPHIQVGQRWTRDGTLLPKSEMLTSEPASFLPRLSLTIRALARISDGDKLETEASREDEKRRVAAFYKSVSEFV